MDINIYERLKTDLENEDYSSLEHAFANLDEDRIAKLEDFLLEIFKNSSNINLLHELALFFKSKKVHKAAPFLISKITSPEYQNKNGTFLYALIDIDCKDYYKEIIPFIANGDYESREMAVFILEAIVDKLDDKEKSEAISMLKSLPSPSRNKPWVDDSINLLSDNYL